MHQRMLITKSLLQAPIPRMFLTTTISDNGSDGDGEHHDDNDLDDGDAVGHDMYANDLLGEPRPCSRPVIS